MNKENIITSKLAHKILISIREKPEIPYRISLELKVVYSHFNKILKLLRKEGLIKEERIDKRARTISLTKKGEKFIESVKNAYDILGVKKW